MSGDVVPRDPAEEPPSDLVPRPLIVASEWAWRSIVIALAIGAVVWGASYLSLVIVPVIVALFAAAVLEPIRARLQRAGMSATWAAALSLTIGIIVVSAFVGLAVGQVVTNFDDLTDQATDGVGEVADWLQDGPLGIRAGGLEDSLDRGMDRLRDDPSQALAGTVSVLSTTGGLFTGGVLALIVTIFVMFDRPRLWGGVCALTPARLRERVNRSGQAAWAILVSYVRVTLLEAVFDSLAIGTAVAIAGVPVAFALGALVFISVFIPILGAVLSGLLIVLVALVTKGFTTALILAIVVLVVQQFDANVLYPVLTSRQISIHPLMSLLLVTSGALIGGLFGAFIAVPFAGMAFAARRAYLGEEIGTGEIGLGPTQPNPVQPAPADPGDVGGGTVPP